MNDFVLTLNKVQRQHATAAIRNDGKHFTAIYISYLIIWNVIIAVHVSNYNSNYKLLPNKCTAWHSIKLFDTNKEVS